MTEVLEELVRQNGLLAAYLTNRDGRAVLSNSAAAELSESQADWIAARFADADIRFSPVRMWDQELVVDLSLPIRALDAAEPGEDPRPVAALLVTLPVTGVFAEFVADRPLSYPGEQTILLQTADGARAEIVTADESGLVETQLDEGMDVGAGLPLAFGERRSLAGSHLVFSAGAEVPGAPWFRDPRERPRPGLGAFGPCADDLDRDHRPCHDGDHGGADCGLVKSIEQIQPCAGRAIS